MTQQKTIEKTFTIKGSVEVMARIERFFALLHRNSRAGHSAYFGMWLDGDGPDAFTVEPRPDQLIMQEAGLVGGVGDVLEVATHRNFTTKRFDHNGKLYVTGVVDGVPTLFRINEADEKEVVHQHGGDGL